MTSGQVGPKLQGGDFIGLCASTQRFEPYQDQAGLQPDEAPAYLFFHTLTGANATLLAYANKKIEDLDNRRKTLSKAIADLSVETLSSQQIELLSGYLDDWENISFEDKRKAADGLISSISATSDYVKIEWKI